MNGRATKASASPPIIEKAKDRADSYAEVVLTIPAAMRSIPLSANLFVETEIVRKKSAILCTRRPRSKDEEDALDVASDNSK